MGAMTGQDGQPCLEQIDPSVAIRRTWLDPSVQVNQEHKDAARHDLAAPHHPRRIVNPLLCRGLQAEMMTWEIRIELLLTRADRPIMKFLLPSQFSVHSGGGRA